MKSWFVVTTTWDKKISPMHQDIKTSTDVILAENGDAALGFVVQKAMGPGQFEGYRLQAQYVLALNLETMRDEQHRANS